VALISRTQSRLEELAERLQSEVPSSKNKVKIFVADLLVPANVNKVAADVISAFGSVDAVYR
jgi:short-subunit dehydrogenase